MVEKNFKYPKAQKLKQKKEITFLFAKGKWETCGKISIITCKNKIHENSIQNKIGVSVSKRFFKKSTDRNRVKRLLREAYRFHKTDFEQRFGQGNLAMIFWNSSIKPNHFSEVESEFLNLCTSKK